MEIICLDKFLTTKQITTIIAYHQIKIQVTIPLSQLLPASKLKTLLPNQELQQTLLQIA